MEVMRCDVAKADEVQRLVAECVAHFGRVDVLVNNVGIVEVGGPEDYPLELGNCANRTLTLPDGYER
ncbi:MAG: hypothetical protein C0522_04285 [Rhodocyclaceae bacterium]|jgi:NAD(P)-dependent dehydrogenase (short-subunit alcohol dehydrogenase family)|nr:hypothetical protein [Rhodocyclaceae bacterium]